MKWWNRQWCSQTRTNKIRNAHSLLCVKWEFYYKFILYLSVLIRSCRFTRSWPVGYICEFATLKSNRYNCPWANDPVIRKRVQAAPLTPYPSVAYLAFAFRGFHNSWFFGFLWKKKYTTWFKNSCLKQQYIYRQFWLVAPLTVSFQMLRPRIFWRGRCFGWVIAFLVF